MKPVTVMITTPIYIQMLKKFATMQTTFVISKSMKAVAVVLLAAALAIVVWDVGLVRRRDMGAPHFIAFAPLAFPALLVAYLVGGLLLVDVFDPRLAVVTVMTGIFVALIVLVTGVQTRWGRPPAGLSDAEAARLGRGPMRIAGPLAFNDRALLRLVLVVAVLLGALWLARTPGTLLSFVPAEQAYLEAAWASASP